MSRVALHAKTLTPHQTRWGTLSPFSMDSYSSIPFVLAAAFLGGELETEQLIARGARVLGRRRRWLRPLAQRVSQSFSGRTSPRLSVLAGFICDDPSYQRARDKYDLEVGNLLAVPHVMCPVPAARPWEVVQLSTACELAEWVGITLGELDWFADRRGFESKVKSGRLRHYHYRVLSKRFGQLRLVEAPKPRLKAIQRQILAEILDHIPAHPAVHGFRHGRSIATFARPHVRQQVVLRIDLQDFFPSIPAARIQSLFRTVGYPEHVADLLAGLCCNTAPADVWEGVATGPGDWTLLQAQGRYGRPHLPQGAPTSPALANLCAYRLDCRLAALARAAGATYTRYADDLAFSGGPEFARAARRFRLHVCATVLEEGFAVHHRKTRIMRRGVRQHLAGLVVNERLNVDRRDYDRLKAMLTNCIRTRPASQNRAGYADFRSHLAGRIAFVEMINPVRGQRLRQLFERIDWAE